MAPDRLTPRVQLLRDSWSAISVDGELEYLAQDRYPISVERHFVDWSFRWTADAFDVQPGGNGRGMADVLPGVRLGISNSLVLRLPISKALLLALFSAQFRFDNGLDDTRHRNPFVGWVNAVAIDCRNRDALTGQLLKEGENCVIPLPTGPIEVLEHEDMPASIATCFSLLLEGMEQSSGGSVRSREATHPFFNQFSIRAAFPAMSVNHIPA